MEISASYTTWIFISIQPPVHYVGDVFPPEGHFLLSVVLPGLHIVQMDFYVIEFILCKWRHRDLAMTSWGIDGLRGGVAIA